MEPGIKKAIILIIGWGFVLLGIVGLFLPVLQGILFLMIGLTILSSEYAWAHRLQQKLRRRFPGASGRLDEARRKAHNWTGRFFHHSVDIKEPRVRR